ncbi:expressed unknown protein [Seminavis robusta]|uniref:Uncharacterized protein n=1 Tax=Seminavis robusta TaxID=568900 RepID=A0A9N8HHC3_9STRA|nr:expressed unknown protein [Seminavis robusta]|eukprot:Sro555_g165640.1 n/a (635) ;mRNA; f:11065-12969
MPRLHDGRRRRSLDPGCYQRRDSIHADDGLETTASSCDKQPQQQQQQLTSSEGNGQEHLPMTESTKGSTATPTPPITQENGANKVLSHQSRLPHKVKPRRRKKRQSDSNAFAAEMETFSFAPPPKRRRESTSNNSSTASLSPSVASANAERDDFPMVTPAASCCASVDSELEPLGARRTGPSNHCDNHHSVVNSLAFGLPHPSKQQAVPKNGAWRSPPFIPQNQQQTGIKPSNFNLNMNDLVASLQRELFAVKERHRVEMLQQQEKHKAEIEGWERKCQEKDTAIQDLKQQHEVSMKTQSEQQDKQQKEWHAKCDQKDSAMVELEKNHAISIQAKDEQHANQIKSWEVRCLKNDTTIKELHHKQEQIQEQHDKDKAEAVEAERKRVERLWEEDKRNLQQQLTTVRSELDNSKVKRTQLINLQESEAAHRTKLQSMSMRVLEMTEAQRTLVKENDRQKAELETLNGKIQASREERPTETKKEKGEDWTSQEHRAASCLAGLNTKTTSNSKCDVEIDLTAKNNAPSASAETPKAKGSQTQSEPLVTMSSSRALRSNCDKSLIRMASPRKARRSGSVLEKLEVVQLPRSAKSTKRPPTRRSSRRKGLPVPTFGLLAKLDLNLEKDIQKRTSKLARKK